ncbi:MAG: MGMT family protein [Chthoniobacteraceae bacterium]|nr:MGMT family protein [Chthoniobacteraceae bacterium]
MKVELSFDGNRLTAVDLPARPPADLTSDALRRLAADLAARPLQFPRDASAFRRRVWEAIRQIPFGQTVTYRELARRIGSPGAARAVGGACAANRLLLAVPCHRVVASRGLGGFALGLEWKRTLLALEAANAAGAPRKTTPGKQG